MSRFSTDRCDLLELEKMEHLGCKPPYNTNKHRVNRIKQKRKSRGKRK